MLGFPEVAGEAHTAVVLNSVGPILNRVRERYEVGEWNLLCLTEGQNGRGGDCILTLYVEEENAWSLRDLLADELATAQERDDVQVAVVVQPRQDGQLAQTYEL